MLHKISTPGSGMVSRKPTIIYRVCNSPQGTRLLLLEAARLFPPCHGYRPTQQAIEGARELVQGGVIKGTAGCPFDSGAKKVCVGKIGVSPRPVPILARLRLSVPSTLVQHHRTQDTPLTQAFSIRPDAPHRSDGEW